MVETESLDALLAGVPGAKELEIALGLRESDSKYTFGIDVKTNSPFKTTTPPKRPGYDDVHHYNSTKRSTKPGCKPLSEPLGVWRRYC